MDKRHMNSENSPSEVYSNMNFGSLYFPEKQANELKSVPYMCTLIMDNFANALK